MRFATLLLAVLFSLLVACGAKGPDLVGTWEGTLPEAEGVEGESHMTLTFRDDGTLSIATTVGEASGTTTAEWDVVSVEENVVTLRTTPPGRDSTLTFSGDDAFEMDDGSVTISFARAGAGGETE